MLRLCSESSRPFTPQGGTKPSPGRSALQALSIFFIFNSLVPNFKQFSHLQHLHSKGQRQAEGPGGVN